MLIDRDDVKKNRQEAPSSPPFALARVNGHVVRHGQTDDGRDSPCLANQPIYVCDGPSPTKSASHQGPVMSMHNPLSYFLDGSSITKQYDSFMDLVWDSLGTIFTAAEVRSQRHLRFCGIMLEIMRESSRLHSKGLLSWKTLATLEHRKPMAVEIVEWFLELVCDACNVRSVTEGNSRQYMECAKVDRCPFTIGEGAGEVVVFGVHLFEKILLSKDENSMQRGIEKIIGPGFEDRQFGLFIQGSQEHYTTGVIHLPKTQAGSNLSIQDNIGCRPAGASVSWRCSMSWPLDSTIRAQLSRFVTQFTGQELAVHVKKVAKQRCQECAPRSLRDLFDNLIHIARGGACDPHSLERDREFYSRKECNELNDDSDALRTFTALSFFKCMGSAGLFDYKAASIRAMQLLHDHDSRSLVLSSDGSETSEEGLESGGRRTLLEKSGYTLSDSRKSPKPVEERPSKKRRAPCILLFAPL
jgi:hypothetical protein